MIGDHVSVKYVIVSRMMLTQKRQISLSLSSQFRCRFTHSVHPKTQISPFLFSQFRCHFTHNVYPKTADCSVLQRGDVYALSAPGWMFRRLIKPRLRPIPAMDEGSTAMETSSIKVRRPCIYPCIYCCLDRIENCILSL